MNIENVNVKKMHHRNAGDTEVAAAHQVSKRVAGKRLQTLQTLFTLMGATGEQVALAAKMPITSTRPRLTELLEMGLIEDTGRRAKNEYQNNEIVWAVTAKGEQYVHQV